MLMLRAPLCRLGTARPQPAGFSTQRTLTLFVSRLRWLRGATVKVRDVPRRFNVGLPEPMIANDVGRICVDLKWQLSVEPRRP
jgi:hypothetical protein